jgi:hypothetical protein
MSLNTMKCKIRKQEVLKSENTCGPYRTYIICRFTHNSSKQEVFKTMSFLWLHMHQNTKMMTVHRSRYVEEGHSLEAHHCSSSVSPMGSQSGLSHRRSTHDQTCFSLRRCCTLCGCITRSHVLSTCRFR